jgi:hypothetical protein
MWADDGDLELKIPWRSCQRGPGPRVIVCVQDSTLNPGTWHLTGARRSLIGLFGHANRV